MFDTTQYKIHQAARLKEQGNAHFKQKNYIKALRAYHQAYMFLKVFQDKSSPYYNYDKTNRLDEAQTNQVDQLRFSVFMNMGQVYNFQDKYDKAVEILNKAAAIRQTPKLLYRRGVAYMRSGELDKAKNDFDKAVHMDQSTKADVAVMLKQLKSREQKAMGVMAERCRKMFASLGVQQSQSKAPQAPDKEVSRD